MINEQIRDKEIRLIGEDGEQLGIMSAKDAMKLAKEMPHGSILINLSGRGDKDMDYIIEKYGIR